jgi:hypothetical protein
VDRDWLYRRIYAGTLPTTRHPTTGHYLIRDDPTLIATLRAQVADEGAWAGRTASLPVNARMDAVQGSASGRHPQGRRTPAGDPTTHTETREDQGTVHEERAYPVETRPARCPIVT